MGGAQEPADASGPGAGAAADRAPRGAAGRAPRGAADQAAREAPLEAVIFDLDGVITDTAEYHYLGWQRLADEMGWDFDREKNEQLRGVSRMESLELILGGRQLPEQEKVELATRKNRYYVESLEQVTPYDLLPGAEALLTACKDAGLPIAIGSSSRNARTVLERLGITELFDAISDGNAVERAKPAPDLFLHAAAQLGAQPARCAVIEDAESGVAAALAAGMLAVGVGPPERVGAAHLHYPTVADVRLEEILEAAANRTHH